jgi:hypothetical protein
LQPLAVTPDGGDQCRLAAGERRYRAAALANRGAGDPAASVGADRRAQRRTGDNLAREED